MPTEHTGTFIDGLIRIAERATINSERPERCTVGKTLTGDMRDAVACGSDAVVFDLETESMMCNSCFEDCNPEVVIQGRKYQ